MNLFDTVLEAPLKLAKWILDNIEALIGIAVVVFFIACGVDILNAVSRNSQEHRATDPCWMDATPISVECLDYRVKQCMALDYSKDQCVILVGGNK